MKDLPINRTMRRGLARRLIAGATLFTFVATPHYAMAAVTDISNAPISSAATTTVPPNVLFILDASGSMDSEFMPDEMSGYAGRASYASHLCNTIYYNPAVKYLVPKKADGTDFADASFTAADNDGFLNTGNTGNPSNLPAGSSTNLTNGYKGTNLSGSEKAFYYKWNGAAAPTTAECQGSAPNASRNVPHTTGNWQKVQIPAAEETNFANWFTYYRTRMQLMKSAAGRAFNGLNDSFRVGFVTICPDGSSCDSDTAVVPVTPNYYLKIDAFAPGHKAAWYTKFYQQEPASYTPLRQALARAGRHFAGKTDGINAGMTPDPIQYSCQQNYAILTTDGYWNYGRGKTLTNGTSGSGDIGNHDNNSGVSPRPMLDSGLVSSVVTQEYYADRRTSGGCNAGAGAGSGTQADRYARTVTTDQYGVVTTSGWGSTNNNTCFANAIINTAVGNGCSSTSNSAPSSGTAGCPVGSPTTSAAGSTANTLADVAAYYYQNDLRAAGSLGALGTDVGTSNNVPASGTGVEDDNATHQHMTTFTLGLGLDGQLKFDENYKTQSSGAFADLRNGTKGWPNPNPSSANTSNTLEQQARIDDLWHAAVNGRGTYFSAKNPTSLTLSLTTALTQIQARLSSAAAAATSTLEPTTGDNLIILPTYTTQEWSGELTAYQIDITPGSPTYGDILPAAVWSARTKLNARTKAACDDRRIKLFRPGATDNMVDFTWNTQVCDGAGLPTGAATTGLDATEQAFFTAAGADEVQDLTQFGTMTDGTSGTADQKTAARGANLVNFLRGQRGKEGYVPNDVNKLYRARKHVLGDIVNSQPLYVRGAAWSYNDAGYAAFATSAPVTTRPAMTYVAANDGMLHAFYATTDSQGGEEAWSYIPRAVLPRLYKLADSNYAQLHEYYVDGRPTRDDVFDTASGTWKTVLVGGLNKGGRGYYALDITNPATPKALWEFTHNPAVCAGAVGAGETSDCHLGYTFGNPVITKLTDGRWVVLVASGYNNVNTPVQAGDGQGYLYVLEAMTGKVLYKIRAGDGTPAFGDASNPSGLAKISPTINEVERNNTTLRVYAGDLLGNIWRFDVNDQRDALNNPVLAPAGREATRIATLKDPASNPQPITVDLVLSEVGSPPVPYLYVATGKYLGTTDTGTTQTQSIYAIKDPLTATTYPDLRVGTLKRLTMTTSGTDRFVNCDTASPTANCSSTNGWYVDLPEPGERVNVSMELQLGTLVVASNVPANTACEPGGFGFLNYFDFQTGFSPAGSTARSGFRVAGLTVGMSIVRLPDGTIAVYRQKHTGELPVDEPVPVGNPPSGTKRATWRELMQ